MGKSFAEIIYDEFKSIEPETARKIYLTICTLNRLEVLVSAGVVKRVHGISFEVIREKFFQPLEAIVQTLDYTPARDRAYQARHPWIAEVVFERAVTTPDERYDLYLRLLDALDVGYGVDRHAFRRLIRARELLVLFPDPRLVRNLYNKAAEMAGNDAYVFQQQPIFEMRRENPNLTAAYELLTHASTLATHDKSITHTLSELEIERAKRSASAVEQGRHLTSVRPKTGDFAVVRCRRRVFSRRILRRVGIFSKKSSPSRAEKAASRDVGGLRATPKRPTSRVGYQNRNRPRLRGHQTSSTASTRFADQTLSFLTLQ